MYPNKLLAHANSDKRKEGRSMVFSVHVGVLVGWDRQERNHKRERMGGVL